MPFDPQLLIPYLKTIKLPLGGPLRFLGDTLSKLYQGPFALKYLLLILRMNHPIFNYLYTIMQNW